MTHTNLLTPHYRKRSQTVRVLRQWRPVALALVAGLFAWGYVEWRATNSVALRREAYERKFVPLKNVLKSIDQVKARRDDLRSRERLSLHLASDAPVTTLLGLVSCSVAAAKGALHVDSVGYASQPAVVAKGIKTVCEKHLVLTGIGNDNLTISAFAASLRDSEIFDLVKLEGIDVVQSEDGLARSFQLTCSVLPSIVAAEVRP